MASGTPSDAWRPFRHEISAVRREYLQRHMNVEAYVNYYSKYSSALRGTRQTSYCNLSNMQLITHWPRGAMFVRSNGISEHGGRA